MPITHIIAASEVQKQQQIQNDDGGWVKVNISKTCKASSSSSPENTIGTISNHHQHQRPVLIDTDAGIDDAWALMMMIQAHKNPSISFNIEGITCVHGITDVENVTKNVGRVLKITEAENIPIYSGCETAFAVPFKVENDDDFTCNNNGNDGFGDTNLPNINVQIQDEHAVNAIVRLAEFHKGNLAIITLGPLTNLAMAIKMNPKLKYVIKEIFVVGGNIEGHGNATISGEFNFVADVESAHVVLTSFMCPIYLLPWETCVKQATLPYSWRLKTIGTMQTEQMKLLNTIETKILNEYKDGWMACDSTLAAALINSKIIKKQEPFHCIVELHGTHTRGLMIVDRGYKLNKNPNVMIITEIDSGLLQKMLIWGVGGPYYAE